MALRFGVSAVIVAVLIGITVLVTNNGKKDDNKLVDAEGREYRVCPQCGNNMYKQGRMWVCENCGYSYVE